MQLVLGARVENRLETAEAAAAAERWRLGTRGRRVVRLAAWAAAFLALALLGALHGATVAIGADGVGELAGTAARVAPDDSLQRELRGAFWRPAQSNAERPATELAPRSWQPERID